MSIIASVDNLNIREVIPEEYSIASSEYHKNLPTYNTNLNNPGVFTIDVNYPDSYVLPHESYILFEGRLTKTDGTVLAEGDNVALVNNGLMYLFDSIEYSMNDKLVERVSNVGQATTILGALKYPNDFALAQGQLQLWQKDQVQEIGVANTGYAYRKAMLLSHEDAANRGKFSLVVPLKHIFGFADTYDKVIFGARHSIKFARADDNNAILRSSTAGTESKVTLTEVAWYLPKVVPSDAESAMLLREVQNRSTIDMRFDTTICEKATVPEGVQTFTWDLGNKATPEVLRYVILAFQTNKLNSQTANPAVFDHCNVRDVMVEYNNERYLYTPYDLDFPALCYGRMYKEATKFSVKYYGMDELMAHSGISFTEYMKVFPFFVVDTSKQRELLRGAVPNIKVEVKLRTGVPAGTVAYAVLITDKRMQLSSDGSWFNILQLLFFKEISKHGYRQ